MADDGVLCYEQPLNERIRTFLRVEHLTARLHHHRADASLWGRRATMGALLDILNVMSRHDIRGQVSKEIEQRRTALGHLGQREDIDRNALDDVLTELDTVGSQMAQIPPQFASYQLRDNELLNSVNNRHAIPGGTCSFDLPAYHHWLAQPAERIEADIAQWYRRVEPVERGVRVLLRLLRDSAEPMPEIADNGVLVHHTVAGTQMIRVLLDDPGVFPEISGGRHRATVRFMHHQDAQLHLRQTETSIAFRMACCRF
ncbi:cell division protein ZapD [Salinisphaera sp.]|uniref:cell division protein ZapD n=1 Tax=Salinisphaera sp. TaxID=1914330 RepID=UPI002D7891CC|nr:cell division protein ZapD [Salinisphaera sp.]HET7313171.1 cell division protein ZapD [Salinisphaera sp.]